MVVFIALSRRATAFMRFIGVMLGLFCISTVLHAQPTVTVTGHNITSKCPAIGASYQAQVKVTGGTPFSSSL